MIAGLAGSPDALAGALRLDEEGSIINVSGRVGQIGLAGSAASAATKAAMSALTHAWAAGSSGVRVSAVAPGPRTGASNPGSYRGARVDAAEPCRRAGAGDTPACQEAQDTITGGPGAGRAAALGLSLVNG